MKMEEVENKYQLYYPELFRKIYFSHEMSLMRGNTVKNLARQFFPNEYVDPYPHWKMLSFSEVDMWYSYLLGRAKESGCRIKENVRFLPFAMEDEGHLYLFDFTTTFESSILCWTKDCEIAIVNKNFEEFICSRLSSYILDYLMPLSHWLIGWHTRYLTEEHRKIFESGNLGGIRAIMQETSCCKWTDYLIY